MAKASKEAAAAEPAPTLVNGKVRLRRPNRKPLEQRARSTPGSPLPPRRLSNASRRKREYLTPDEVDKLAAGNLGRHGAHDRTLILIVYRHGQRVSELVALRWDQVDLKAGPRGETIGM
jgi:integrase